MGEVKVGELRVRGCMKIQWEPPFSSFSRIATYCTVSNVAERMSLTLQSTPSVGLEMSDRFERDRPFQLRNGEYTPTRQCWVIHRLLRWGRSTCASLWIRELRD